MSGGDAVSMLRWLSTSLGEAWKTAFPQSSQRNHTC